MLIYLCFSRIYAFKMSIDELSWQDGYLLRELSCSEYFSDYAPASFMLQSQKNGYSMCCSEYRNITKDYSLNWQIFCLIIEDFSDSFRKSDSYRIQPLP